MKIILEQEDITKAICDHVEKLGVNLLNKTVTVDITVGRGNNGDTATIAIEEEIVQHACETTEDVLADEGPQPTEAVEEPDGQQNLFDK